MTALNSNPVNLSPHQQAQQFATNIGGNSFPQVNQTAAGSPTPANIQHQQKRRRPRPTQAVSSPTNQVQEDIDDDSIIVNTPSSTAPSTTLPEGQVPTQHVVPESGKPAGKKITTRAAIAEWLKLEEEHDRLSDELKKIAEMQKKTETRMVSYMRRNDIEQVTINELFYLALRYKMKRQKPKYAVMLQRLRDLMETGERDAEKILIALRAPVLVTPEYVVSKRKRRKNKSGAIINPSAVNQTGSAVPMQPMPRT